MVEVDLHIHTNRSDGRLTPAQVIKLAAGRGLKVVSITDHDSTSAIDEAREAAKDYPQLTVIPGVEISTDVADTEVHILAYFVNKDDAEFQRSLQRFRDARYERGRQMLAKLEQMGMALSWERVLELAGEGAVGRPHVARAMVEKGYVGSMQEAFDRHLGRNCPAYVERDKMAPEEAIAMALENGALPVLAHPGFVKDLDSLLPRMVDAGLVGIEAYYDSVSEEEVASVLEFARENGLIPCGGTDYHANGNEGEVEPGDVGPPMESVERLAALKAQRDGR